jgi:hypothetical protein
MFARISALFHFFKMESTNSQHQHPQNIGRRDSAGSELNVDMQHILTTEREGDLTPVAVSEDFGTMSVRLYFKDHAHFFSI